MIGPWGPKEFFSVTGYSAHHLGSYVPKPESEIILSRPSSAEPSAEDRPFYLAKRYPDDPRTCVDLTTGSCILSLPLRYSITRLLT